MMYISEGEIKLAAMKYVDKANKRPLMNGDLDKAFVAGANFVIDLIKERDEWDNSEDELPMLEQM